MMKRDSLTLLYHYARGDLFFVGCAAQLDISLSSSFGW